MARSFIGKPISLISHSDVRYRRILAGIDSATSTIQLRPPRLQKRHIRPYNIDGL
ncbi:hypothetical protein BDZ89DRAFT_1071463 [Hymenopellis radicata]|nr:hypothetical protein BDZ89DRAFT_1071463 [Hymenopellis radicata]